MIHEAKAVFFVDHGDSSLEYGARVASARVELSAQKDAPPSRSWLCHIFTCNTCFLTRYFCCLRWQGACTGWRVYVLLRTLPRFSSHLFCLSPLRLSLSPGICAVPSGTATQQAQGSSIGDQAARQLKEISHKILPALGRPVAEEDLKTWTANLRNLRVHTREDMQHIVDESNKKVLEAVTTARADQSIEIRRCAGELLQAMTTMGTSQSAGQRWLAREVAGLTVRIPSHAVLLPPREDESAELTDAEREASSWIQRLSDWRAHGKRRGKGVVSKEYRLFFLCGHDRSLAECGFEGKGYRIKCPRTWVKKSLPFAKALLIVVSATLKAFAGLSIPADGIVSAAGKGWDEILSSAVESVAEASIDAACSTVDERLDEGSAAAESVDQTGLADVGHGLGDNSNVSSKLVFLVHEVVVVGTIAEHVIQNASRDVSALPLKSTPVVCVWIPSNLTPAYSTFRYMFAGRTSRVACRSQAFLLERYSVSYAKVTHVGSRVSQILSRTNSCESRTRATY